MFLSLFVLFYKGRLTPLTRRERGHGFILGGFVDYSFSAGLFLMHLPTIPPRLFTFFLHIPLGLQKLDLSI
jgi:hypothetical protein